MGATIRKHQVGPWACFRVGIPGRWEIFDTRAEAEDHLALIDAIGLVDAQRSIRHDTPDLRIFEDRIKYLGGGSGVSFATGGPHVYQLWGRSRTRPVYVGASMNVMLRVGQHVQRRGSEFNRVSFIRCDTEATMWAVEALVIRHYRPRLNVVAGRSQIA